MRTPPWSACRHASVRACSPSAVSEQATDAVRHRSACPCAVTLDADTAGTGPASGTRMGTGGDGVGMDDGGETGDAGDTAGDRKPHSGSQRPGRSGNASRWSSARPNEAANAPSSALRRFALRSRAATRGRRSAFTSAQAPDSQTVSSSAISPSGRPRCLAAPMNANRSTAPSPYTRYPDAVRPAGSSPADS